MKRKVSLFFLVFVCFSISAQSDEVKDLRKQLKTHLTYTQKADVLFKLGLNYQNTSPDSTYKYANQLKTLAKNNNDKIGESKAMLLIARYLCNSKRPSEGLEICEENIKFLQNNTEHAALLVSFLQTKGNCQMLLNKKQEALSSFYASLKICEKLDSTTQIASAIANIGWVYMEMFQYKKAIVEFNKAVKILLEANNEEDSLRYLPLIYNNLAACYGASGELDSAYLYTEKAIEIALKNNDNTTAANGLNILGEVLIEQKKYSEALEKLLQAKDLREKVGNPFYIVSDLSTLAQLYGAMGKTDEGIKTCEEALVIAKKNKLDAKLPVIYFALAYNYEMAGNYKEATAIYKHLNEFKDTLFEKTNAESLAKMQVQYETEKKETENILLKKENALKQAKIVNKNRTIYILIATALLGSSLLFAWIVVIRLRKKESEMKSITQLQKEKERIARDLHDNVGGQLSYIIYSLDGINDESKEKRTEITESVNQSVRSVIGNLRETIWAISDANINLQDFSDKLKLFARHLFKHVDVKVNIIEDVHLEKELNALLGLNLYRICQEILTNSFKHSKADEITINLRTNDDELLITIFDNGIGFDTSHKKEDSYGLQNLYKRSSEFGIYLEIESVPNKGTKYELVV